MRFSMSFNTRGFTCELVAFNIFIKASDGL